MYICNNCKEVFPLWKPSCPDCSKKGTLEKKQNVSIVRQDETATKEPMRLPTSFPIFNSVFAGGFLRGFLYFLHATRGAGKTTFLLQVCSFLVSQGFQVVYFSFDEGQDGIMKKCVEYGLLDNLPVFIFVNNPLAVKRALCEYRPDLVVLDSAQVFAQYDDKSVVRELDRLHKNAQQGGYALIVIGEEQRGGKRYKGSASIGHIVDVEMMLKKDENDNVVISTPEKNRDTDDRTSQCFFRRTPAGLIEITESETGCLLRHTEKDIIGLASFIAQTDEELFADEITAAVLNYDAEKLSLTIDGMNTAKVKNLLAVINKILSFINIVLTIRNKNFNKMFDNIVVTLSHNNGNRLNKDAEVACVMAVLSLLLDEPLPVETVFIGGVDNHGHLLSVDAMEQRVKRAKALGYTRVIGPKAIGSQIATWDEFDTLRSIIEELFKHE